MDRTPLPMVPSKTEADVFLQKWRVKALNILLLVTVVTGLPAYAIVVVNAVRQGRMTGLIAIYLLCYIATVSLLVWRRIDFRIKAWGFIGLSMVNAAASLTRLGLSGSGRLWLVVLPIIAAVVMGARASYITAISGIALYGVFAGLAHFRVLETWVAFPPDPFALGFWIEGGTALLVFIPVMVVLVERYVRLHLQTLEEANRGRRELERLTGDLRRSEKGYRSIIENIQDAFCRSDKNGRLVVASPSAAKIFGYDSVEEMMGRYVGTFWLNPKDRELLIAEIKRTGGVKDFEGILKRKDSSTFNASLTMSFYHDDQGNPQGTEGIIRDITERKQTEEALRKSEESALRLAKENAVMAEIGRIISSTLDIKEAYPSFCEKVKEILPYDRITINLVGKDGSTLIESYVEGEPVPRRDMGDVFPKAGTLTEAVMGHRKSLILDSGDENEIATKYPGLLPEMRAGYRSFLSVPLISGDEPIGGLHFRSKQYGYYSEKDLRVAESIGNQIAGAIANAQLYLERKRAEEEVRESEERWQFALEGTGDGVWDWNPETNKVYFSRQWKAMLGYEESEISDTLDEWAKRVHPDDYPGALADLDNHFKGKSPVYTNEHRLLCKGGGYKWILDRGKVIRRTEGGNPLRVIGTHADITERKRAEEALRKSESEAQSLLKETIIMAEIGRIISSTLDIGEVYERFAAEVKKLVPFDRISINEINVSEGKGVTVYSAGLSVPARMAGAVYPLAGSLADELLRIRSGLLVQGKALEEFVMRTPSYSPSYQAGIRSLVAAPLVSRNRIVGTLLLGLIRTDAYSNQDLRLVERIGNQIAGAIANIQLYQKEKRMEKELLKSEERYRFLVDLSPLMVFTHRRGKFVYLNSATLKALGASKMEDLVDRSIYEVVHSDYWDVVKERINQIEKGIEVSRIEEKYIRLDKSVIDVELNHVQVLDQDGPTILVMGRDITEQKRAEREKAVLQEQLQQAQKMEAIGTLAGGIAHDFNNILAAILGYAELAGLDIPEVSKARYNLQQSIKSAHRAKDLVNQILAFSRQGMQERKPMDIKPIVKEALKFLRASLPTTIEIRQEIEEDPGTIEADPTQVYQVLMNLCTNAAHAMSDHGGVLEVLLNKVDLDGGISSPSMGLEPGPFLRLRVSDTGHGIPPEILPRIFDPYFTTKEVGKGTGLGLAVVNGIVKSYGGGIAVSSEVGKGSTFDIYFPRVESPISVLGSGKVEPLPLGGHERALFVDDEAAIVEIGKSHLEYLGYEVVARTSSVEALEVFKESPERFDLVITDMTMPNMTGDKLAQEILEIRPGIPIILCTGFSESISEEKAKSLGIREFVMKPLVMKDLAQAVRRALESRKKKKG